MQSRWFQSFLAVLAAALIAVMVVMWLSEDDGVSLTVGEPQVVSVSELEGFAEDADRPIYWLGEKAGAQYEVTETEGGRVYVRYLPLGGDGGERAEYLTVGSYPVEGAAGALEKTAGQSDTKEIARSDGGAVVLIDTESPSNAHLAYPGADLQIEIFSPVSGEALRLAAKDRVRPVP